MQYSGCTVNPWSVGMVQDRNKDLVLTEFSKN